MTDAFQRFVDAQAGAYQAALAEIRRGRKTSHWMWFVFPQLAGLGRSPTAQHFALASVEEARAYLAHPLLGPRLRECAAAVAAHAGRSALDIFGAPDDLKLRSSLTLFEQADHSAHVFSQALDAVCGGVRDPLTLRLIAGGLPDE
jgi:uncharacterized protein (DUF1810 family)